MRLAAAQRNFARGAGGLEQFCFNFFSRDLRLFFINNMACVSFPQCQRIRLTQQHDVDFTAGFNFQFEGRIATWFYVFKNGWRGRSPHQVLRIKSKFGFHAGSFGEVKCLHLAVVGFANWLCRRINQLRAAEVEVERPEEKFVRRNRHGLCRKNKFLAGQI